METYKSFTLFNDVENKNLQAFNRLNIMLNMNDSSMDYYELFNKADKKLIDKIAKELIKHGRTAMVIKLTKEHQEGK